MEKAIKLPATNAAINAIAYNLLYFLIDIPIAFQSIGFALGRILV